MSLVPAQDGCSGAKQQQSCLAQGPTSRAPNFKTTIANPVILEMKKLSLGEEEWEDVCVKGTPVLSLYLAS